MLRHLEVRNFAIIERLSVDFEPGFNVLTGETGAGKSIVIDALSCLLGARTGPEVVRSQQRVAYIEGLFDLWCRPEVGEELVTLLREHGLAFEPGEELVLSREVSASGRSVCRVNGRALPQATIASLSSRLADLHSQGQQVSLLSSAEQLSLLDRFGGLQELRSEVARLAAGLRALRQELEALEGDARERARREEMLRFQAQEIEAARLANGEEEALLAERHRLVNAERLAALSEEAYSLLYEDRGGGESASELLGEAGKALDELTRLDAALAEESKAVEGLVGQVEEVARALRAYREGLEADPGRLAQVEERLDLIARLKRKYGSSVAEVLAYREGALAELASLGSTEERREALASELEGLSARLAGLAAELSARRQEATLRLQEAVAAELASVGLGKVRFSLLLSFAEGAEGLEMPRSALAGLAGRRLVCDSTGVDHLDFLVATNPGEPARPLAKVASGGETSRLMLALKAALSRADPVATLVFDEIDVGVGGRSGQVVGEKLWALAREHQVICVTHLPQIACYADAHFSASKVEEGGRTVAGLRRLEGREWLEELTLMLGRASEATRRSAREMVEQAQARKACLVAGDARQLPLSNAPGAAVG